jgi:23S rRNA (uracil1939-C5)-methyltransferase
LQSSVARKPERALRAGSEADLLFTDLMANGQAVGRLAGLVVFCFGPLPGERARVRITDVKASYAVARLIESYDASPDRATPFCPVFGECGGCQVQHLSYAAQLRWKREIVKNALQRIGGFDGIEVHETIGMEYPRAYRNKMSLVVEHRGERVDVGFYRMRSHEIVPVRGCPVVMPELDAYIGAFAEARPSSAVHSALEGAHHAVARYANASDETVLSITTDRRSKNLAGVASSLHQTLPRLAGVVNSYEARSANAVLGSKNEVVEGEGEIEERIDGIRYRVSTASFFQVNTEIVAHIFESLSRLAHENRVVDLYCGMGTFSVWFARRDSHVIGVEENPHAVEEAKHNATLNRVEQRAEFHCRRVEQFANSSEGRKAIASADLVFLDPPRKGSDEVTLLSIARARVPRLAYLSCDPATLARDLKVLASNGYRPESVQPFDMFPQTGHVESLAIMETV